MWLQQTSPRERRTLLAGFLGYGLDGFDFMIYTFVIPTLLTAFSMTKAEAGAIATAALLTSAVGGWAAGILADRYGRTRILELTVLWFAVFTCLSGFTHSYGELLLTRAMQGFGFGGEWSVGSVLVAETVAARHRGKAAGLVQSSWAVGWALAAVAFWGVYAVVPPELGWRILFWIGVAPALLIVYVRRRVEDSPVYLAGRRRAEATAPSGVAFDVAPASGDATSVTPPKGAGSSGASSSHSLLYAPPNSLAIFKRPLLRTTALASLLSTGMLGAYYSVTTWLPTYLKTERQLSVAGTSGYLLVLIGGSFAGYLTSAWASDLLGRRRCFVLFAVGGMLLVIAYMGMAATDVEMLIVGFPLGFFLSGIFSGMGAFLTELYPNAVRGAGQGFCYNFGRAVGAVCPALIGAWSARLPLGVLICGMSAAAYTLVIIAAWALPETRGRALIGEPAR